MRHDIDGIAYDLDGTFYPNYRLNLRLVPFTLREWRLLLAFGRARNVIRAAQEGKGPETAVLPALVRGQGAALPAAGGRDFYDVQAWLTAGMIKGEPAAVKAKIARLIYRGWEEHFRGIKLFPGVRETLAAFREAGLRQGLLSDFPPEQKLAHLGLAGFWDATLCSERTGRLKPDPLPFQELAGVMGLPPERILYVGNSVRYDMRGARRAGMKTALISFSPLHRVRAGGGADFVFHDYRQLLKYVIP